MTPRKNHLLILPRLDLPHPAPRPNQPLKDHLPPQKIHPLNSLPHLVVTALNPLLETLRHTRTVPIGQALVIPIPAQYLHIQLRKQVPEHVVHGDAALVGLEDVDVPGEERVEEPHDLGRRGRCELGKVERAETATPAGELEAGVLGVERVGAEVKEERRVVGLVADVVVRDALLGIRPFWREEWVKCMWLMKGGRALPRTSELGFMTRGM